MSEQVCIVDMVVVVVRQDSRQVNEKEENQNRARLCDVTLDVNGQCDSSGRVQSFDFL